MSEEQTYRGVTIFKSERLHAEHVSGTTYRIEEEEYFAAIPARDWLTSTPQQRLIRSRNLTTLHSQIDVALAEDEKHSRISEYTA